MVIANIKGIIQDKLKWKLVLGGLLFYFSYTYAFFMFAAKLTFLYLFHLPVFGLSTIGFFMLLLAVLGRKTIYVGKNKKVKRIVLIYLSVITLLLASIWFTDIISHLIKPGHTSNTPDGEAPMTIYSLDLAVVLPLMVLALIKYYKNHKGGFILTGILLTKTSILGFTLMAMTLSMYLQDLSPDPYLAVLWCIIGIIGTALTLLFLKQLRFSNL